MVNLRGGRLFTQILACVLVYWSFVGVSRSICLIDRVRMPCTIGNLDSHLVGQYAHNFEPHSLTTRPFDLTGGRCGIGVPAACQGLHIRCSTSISSSPAFSRCISSAGSASRAHHNFNTTRLVRTVADSGLDRPVHGKVGIFVQTHSNLQEIHLGCDDQETSGCFIVAKHWERLKPKVAVEMENTTLDTLLPVHLLSGKQLPVRFFVELMQKASEAVLGIYGQDDTHWQIQYKNGHEPLTKADLAANQIICDALTGLGPLLVSEENQASHAQDVRQSEREIWLIDPIDGTKEFIKRNGQFTVNIGLCTDGRPVFGIVSIPASNELYFGGEGIGSFKMKLFGSNEIQSINAAPVQWHKEGLRVVASVSHLNGKTCRFIEQLKSASVVQCGSSIKFLRVAEGSADIYPRFALCSEWDTCASHAILNAAGGKVLQYADGKWGGPVKYNKESLLSPQFVAFGYTETLEGIPLLDSTSADA